MGECPDRSFEHRRFRRLGTKADVWALSSEAEVAKDIFAAVASGGKRDFGDLRASIAEGELDGWDAAWVARLARVIALQPFETELHEFALEALKLAVPTLPRTPALLPVRKVLFELLFQVGDFEGARDLVENDPSLATMYHGYLGADLLNPFVTGSSESFDGWLEGFNAPFVDAGLSPIQVARDAASPFDSLSSTVEPGEEEGPVVSVIVTTFNPEPSEIRTSVYSILQQTWKNLEVLLIDDHSEESAIGALEQLASEDPRVKLIRQPVNGGTYRARNVGIRAASGKYLTGQDTDDWSHPERIARQVAVLEADPDLPGVTAAANRTDDRLVKVSLGNSPHRRCEVSLMLRVETAAAVGGYLPVRKAADSEFRERVEAWCGAPVHVLNDPLYVIRMSPGSLSRADFRPGWSHHARRGFWSSYKNWHDRAEREELAIDATDPEIALPATAPPRIAGREWPQGTVYNVCLISDWRGSAAEQRATLDELYALVDTELDIAILHFDTPWGAGPRAPRALAPEVQQLVSDGKVRRVYADEEIEVDLLVVRDPATVDYARRAPSSIRSSRTLMVAHSNPAGRDATLRRYDPEHAHEMAREIFGGEPEWVIPDGQELKRFRNVFDFPTLDDVFPLVLDIERYAGARLRRSGARLVLGKVADNESADWPEVELLREVFPTDGSIDLRILGDARGALRVLGERRLPVDWMHFRYGEIAADVFWRTVDAVAIYDHPGNGRVVERPVLEALASGAPVITDGVRAELYSGAVLAAHPDEALELVTNLLADSSRMQELQEKGRQLIQDRTRPRAFYEFMHRCVTETHAGVERHV